MIYEDLKGRNVLVTGASSGIGSATAVLFSEQGCFVGVHYFSTKTGAEKTLEQVKKTVSLPLRNLSLREQGASYFVRTFATKSKFNR